MNLSNTRSSWTGGTRRIRHAVIKGEKGAQKVLWYDLSVSAHSAAESQAFASLDRSPQPCCLCGS